MNDYDPMRRAEDLAKILLILIAVALGWLAVILWMMYT